MATIQVTTPAEFLTAIQTSGADVVLMNDIDMNDTFISDVITITASAIKSNGNENFKVYNLQGLLDIGIFRNPGVLTISNVDFLNLNVGYLWNNSGYTNNINTLTFNNCNFQGSCNNSFFIRWYGSTSSNVTCNYCSFNITFNAANAKLLAVNRNTETLNYCYLKLKWSGTCSSSYVLAYSIQNCYIEGRFAVSSSFGTNSYLSMIGNSNVYNIEWVGNTTATARIYGISTNNIKSVINSTKLTNTNLTIVIGPSNNWVTDEQMKNAEYLYNLGFNIAYTP